jgi:hypothetical protein
MTLFGKKVFLEKKKFSRFVFVLKGEEEENFLERREWEEQ